MAVTEPNASGAIQCGVPIIVPRFCIVLYTYAAARQVRKKGSKGGCLVKREQRRGCIREKEFHSKERMSQPAR